MATINPRVKRVYQPSITPFLVHADPPNAYPQHTPRPQSPCLPDFVQSSLLSVGMRVRKAVPGGYQTRLPFKEADANALWTTQPARPAELAPFCGIHKIGGYEIPPNTSSRAPEVSMVDDNDDFPSSQESFVSISSTDSTARPPVAVANHRKRSLDREDTAANEDSECLNTESADALRPIARPVARRRHLRSTAAPDLHMLDMTDFGEADFLQPPR